MIQSLTSLSGNDVKTFFITKYNFDKPQPFLKVPQMIDARALPY